MHRHSKNQQHGSALICALCAILIVSVIAGSVLLNCVVRYNVSSKQVRGWKEALYAAETGADIAYAEVRKTISDPPNSFSGWGLSGSIHTSSETTLGAQNLTTNSTVDRFHYDWAGNAWYRIRARGTAPIIGLKRTGIDNRMNVNTRGDNLLRKIDFSYDHFIAAYGPNGDGVGKAVLPVAQPQVTRRIELIAAPITPFEAAVKCISAFQGPGSAGWIDSFDSRNGSYYFAANDPTDPRYSDSRSGSVAVASPNFETFNGTIYGNVSTNGGTVVPTSQIEGLIDNNVPFTIPPFKMPTTYGAPQASPTKVVGLTAITPPVPGTPNNPTYYLFSSFTHRLNINAFRNADNEILDTYVAIHVTNDITGKIDIEPAVHAKIFFDGNMEVQARDIVNQSNIAGNLQFYGISPSDPAQTQTIDIGPPGDFAATFYAPNADFHMNGNPDIIGAIVCKTYYGNGNTTLHYDRALSLQGDAIDYRIASYVEDIR